MRHKILMIALLLTGCGASAFYYLNGESPAQTRERYLASGTEYLQQGQVAEAVIMFKNAVQVDPNSAEARYELGLALLRRRDFSQAFVELRRAVDLKPNLIKARHQLGSLYLLDRNIPAAKQQLTKISEQDPNALEARYLGAALALGEKDTDRALKEMRQAVSRAENEKNPNLGEIYIELGNIHLLKRDWQEAEKSYRGAVELDRRLLRAREGLATVYLAKGDPEKARQELILATQTDPENEDAWHRLGDFYARTKHLDEYEKIYRELSQAKPKSLVVKKKMAEIELKQRRRQIRQRVCGRCSESRAAGQQRAFLSRPNLPN
jgi:Tfp pilus assembly protein PilF